MHISDVQDALAHHQAGRLKEAIQGYEQLQENGRHSPTLDYLLGTAYRQQNRQADAIFFLERAVSAEPTLWMAWLNLGIIQKEEGQLIASLISLEHAIHYKPSGATYRARGMTFSELGRHKEALADYSRANELEPRNREYLLHLANTLYNQGQRKEALLHYQEILDIDPNNVEAILHKAFITLAFGNYHEGWRLYESPPERRAQRSKGCPQGPQVKSLAELQGRTLLIWPEGGMGDQLHFSRYALLAEQAGAHVIITATPPLFRLFRQSLPPSIAVHPLCDPLPSFDYWQPVMGLMQVFRTSLETVPAPIPYLHSDHQDAKSWQLRLNSLSNLSKPFRIGIAWAGASDGNRPYSRDRDAPLSALSPLLSLPYIQYYSLQKDPLPATQLREGPWQDRVIDWTTHIKDFADTAALIENLDLVITVDTSILHLAGAMGKPVWLLDRVNHCWRWLDGRYDSPWYPTLRIFRQTTLGDWNEPVIEMLSALKDLFQPNGARI